MSYPGYPPYQQGSNSYPQQPYTGAPYPPSSAPYPPQGNMSQPYAGMGGTPYPSQGGSASYPHQGGAAPYPSQGGAPCPSQGSPYTNQAQPHTGAPYPPSSAPYPQGNMSQPYAGMGGTLYPSQGGASYPSQGSPYTNQPHSPYTSQPSHSSYPNQASHSPYPSQPSYPGSQGPYGATQRSPTVVPAHPFNPREDAEVLRKAMKGFGTDEKAIINVLTRRTNAQRLEIKLHFKTLYGKDLVKDLKSELTGNFENLVMAMMTPLPQFYAKELHDAIGGLGTDETVLTEVLCTLSNEEIRTIRAAYHQEYYQNLESDLKGDTGGHFKRLLVSLCSAGRDESMMTNAQAASADAQALFSAGELRFGTDESTFNMILCQRNHAQLRLVFDEYQRLTGHDIEKAIKNEFSGDVEDGLLAVVRSIENQAAFFAKCLNKSVKLLGTNDRDLMRLVVTRSEIDMGDIKRAYAAKYGESLADAIKGDCSGDYKKCLLALIGEL